MKLFDRKVTFRLRRLVRYVGAILSVCGLLAIALATFWPTTPANKGSLPPRQNNSLLMNANFVPQTSGQPGPGDKPKPVESHLTKAGTYTGDVRSLPYAKPKKEERPEREEPEPIPSELIVPNTAPADAIAVARSGIQSSRPSVSGAAGATSGTNAAAPQPAPLTSANLPGSVLSSIRGFLEQSGVLLNSHQNSKVSAPAPAPLTTFDGLDFAAWGNGHPPDTNGDVGPVYYIQTVNTSIGIYNKATGVRVAAFTFDTFMSQGSFGNLCDTDNFGDPVVLYDTFEDRWIITDFAFQLDASGNVINPPGAYECFAVSRTGDPVSGGWYFYSINTSGGLGDYPKLGVWPDGIYMSVNMFDYAASGSFQTARVYAFNKMQMYAGSANPQVVSFDAPAAEFTLLPANARLQTGTPPAGSPNYFAVVWQYLNAVSVYKFHVDWNSISTSTFTGPYDSIMPFWWAQYNRGGGATTAPSPANPLDTLYPRLMVQNQYSNIGGVESVWLSHTTGAGNPTSNTTSTQAAVRYYQVRVTGGTIEANARQSYTYSPDTTLYRFMPSVGIDRLGNMAIGYSTSNATTNPALKYAGRLYTDTVNTITQDEQTLWQGTGSQQGTCGGSTCVRWGDYSAMTLDPDGCTFWYTNEYYATNGLNDLTRIGSFRYPTCTPINQSGAITGTVIDAGTSSPLSGATVMLGSRTATTNASGVYVFPNLPAGVYQSVAASYPGYATSSTGPLTVTAGLTTTQNFTLSIAATSGCLIDTTQANFQTGVPTNCDLTSSPGNVTLLDTASRDQHADDNNFGSGYGFDAANLIGQTFTPGATGQLTRVDAYIFCASCSGANPDMTLEIRTTSGGNPVMTVGGLLASSTISGTSSGASGLFIFNYNTPPTLNAGTQYGMVIRLASNRATGTQAWLSTNGDVYAGGRRKDCSTASCGNPTGPNNNSDLVFASYMRTGYSSTGTFVSSLKDANSLTTHAPRWNTLSWTATTPASTSIRFQAAGSNNPSGPFTFVGPDGTASTYFTTTGASLSQFDGFRYLKYAAYLTTTNAITTPTLADVTICYSNTSKITTVTLASSANPSLAGQSVTFTANVTSTGGIPTGQVQFKDNGVNLGLSQTLSSGVATITTSTLSIGTHIITADYLTSTLFNAGSGTLASNQVVTSTVTWTGNTNANWFNASNWSPIVVPTTPAQAIVPSSPGGNRWPVLTGTTTIYTLTIQSGARFTLTQGITLFVNGDVANSGTLAQIKDVPGSATTEFLHITDASGTVDKYHGVDLTPASAMNATTVQIKGNQAACTSNSGDLIIRRCYQIDPTTPVSTTVRFWFTEAERNAQTANALRLWHWGPWTQVGTIANYSYSESGAACTSGSGQACWFQSTGVSTYSPFVLGSGSVPTAIHLIQLEAHSNAGWLILVTGAVLLTGVMLITIKFKRRRV